MAPDKPKKSVSKQPTAITVRGSKEWRSWVEKMAKHCMTDTSKLVDAALARYGKEQGFDEPRPDRQGENS